MLKRFLPCCAILILALNSKAQSPCTSSIPAEQWDRTLGGNNDDLMIGTGSINDPGHHVVQTNDGGYLIGGISSSTISGDKTVANWGNGGNFWIVKTNSAGTKLWDKRYGGTGADQLWSIVKTTDNGFLLAGITTSVVSGDITQPKRDTGRYSTDYWVIKIDSVGNKQWDARFGGDNYDQLQSAIQTRDGGYLLAGSTFSGISGDKTQACFGASDYWVVKINSLGIKQWDKDFGGTSDDNNVYGLVQTPDGGYVLGGTSLGGPSGNKTAANYYYQNANYGDMWLVKIDSNGNKLWDRVYGGDGSEEMRDMIKTADGGYALYGFSNSPASGTKTHQTYQNETYWIEKLDSAFNPQWDADFGTGLANYSHPSCVAQTLDGGYILSGTTYNAVGGAKTSPGNGAEDFWIVKIDGTGQKQWDADYGGSDNDDLFSVISTSDGGALLAGHSGSYNTATKSENPKGYRDYWMVKLGRDSVNTSFTTGIVTSTICAGSALRIPYTIGCTANSGNVFTAQLSNAAGSFANAVNIGTLSATGSDTVIATVPLNTAAGAGYRIRVVSSNPGITATDNGSNISVLAPSSSTFSRAICAGASYAGHTATGTFVDHYTNSVGCDSTRTLNLTVLQPATSNITQSICQGGSYLGHSTSGTYIDTLHNASSNGCDSIRTLHLTVLQPSTSTINQSICQGGIYLGHSTNGTFVDTLHNAASNGCDSIRILHLTVNNPTTASISGSFCQGGSYNFYGRTLTSVGTYHDTLRNSNGCDSIVTLTLTLNSYSTGAVRASICAGSSYTFNNQPLTQAGTYYDTVQGSNCDSIITLTLTIKQPATSTINQSICAGQSYLGHNSSGTYVDTLHNAAANGCDSIRTLNLTVNHTYRDTVSQAICQGDSYQGHNAAGIYIDSLHSAGGCDSIKVLVLTVNPLPQPTITKSGDTLSTQSFATYQWLKSNAQLNGETNQKLVLTQNGSYAVLVTDASGCSDTSATFSVTGVGIGETTMDQSITLYPNPNNGKFVIAINTPIQQGKLELLSIQGQILYSAPLKEQSSLKKELNFIDLAKGVYLLKVNTENGVAVKRVVVE